MYATAIKNLKDDPSKWGGTGLLPSSELDPKYHTVLHLMSLGMIKSFRLDDVSGESNDCDDDDEDYTD
jgi:hypothetical protein